jgi:hypothetical protein
VREQRQFSSMVQQVWFVPETFKTRGYLVLEKITLQITP